MPAEHLIIFVKNPIEGQVKTRIARTVGHQRAVEVYQHLLRYTQQLTVHFPGHRVVYYGDFINSDDGWNGYDKQLQAGHDLGERMLNAFREQFDLGAEKVVVIGSDCLSITPEHLTQAFQLLDTADVVMGPASDGGYYLLGMKQPQPVLFENMPWSQPNLRQLTEETIAVHNLKLAQLDELTDIDEWSDYEPYAEKTQLDLKTL